MKVLIGDQFEMEGAEELRRVNRNPRLAIRTPSSRWSLLNDADHLRPTALLELSSAAAGARGVAAHTARGFDRRLPLKRTTVVRERRLLRIKVLRREALQRRQLTKIHYGRAGAVRHALRVSSSSRRPGLPRESRCPPALTLCRPSASASRSRPDARAPARRRRRAS
jgi:hypothetical protein